jgi:hypothetical protein
LEISEYLASLRSAADSAAAAAVVEYVGKWEAAAVLVTVTSYGARRPSCHGIKVNPSGRYYYYYGHH